MLVAKIAHTRSWMGVAWCGFGALIRGGRPIRRLQLFVKALCHHCPDNPLACPCVDGHLHVWDPTQLEHFQTLFQFYPFFTLFVTLSTGVIPWTLNFENGVLRNGQELQCARRAWLRCSWSYEDTECSWSRAEIRGSFCAKTTMSTWTNLELLLLNKEERIRKMNFRQLPHTVAFSCLPRSFWVLLIIKGTKRRRLGA